MKFQPGFVEIHVVYMLIPNVFIDIKHAKIFMIDHDQACLVKD